MNRIITFSSRNIKELLRDPLSYIFCLGFPLLMLIIMTMVNDSIPEEAGMVIFRIDYLSGGIAVFGQTFIMLFICLSAAKDRAGSFLVRLYASPMRSADFILGYMLPVLVLSVAQSVISFAASLIISAITGVELSIAGILLSIVVLLPSAVLFTGTGLLFGALFSEKAAPGMCSIVISISSFLGGIWFDVDGTEGVLRDICSVLPYYHCTAGVRCATALNFDELGTHLLITSAYTIAVTVLAAVIFRSKMRADLA